MAKQFIVTMVPQATDAHVGAALEVFKHLAGVESVAHYNAAHEINAYKQFVHEMAMGEDIVGAIKAYKQFARDVATVLAGSSDAAGAMERAKAQVAIEAFLERPGVSGGER